MSNFKTECFIIIRNRQKENEKSTPDEIREHFDKDVERFSNLETEQKVTIDATLQMDLIPIPFMFQSGLNSVRQQHYKPDDR